MAKKVLIFKGSPRKKGFTQQILDELIRGVKESGGEPVLYELSSREIIPCRGCTACYTRKGCSIKDYLTPMYEQMEEGASVVVASPLYYATITGITKVWLDRMHPVMDEEHWDSRYPGLKYLTIFVSGNVEDDPMADEGIDFTERSMLPFSWNHIGRIWVKYTDRPGFVLPEEVKQQAYEYGKELAAD